MKNSLKNYLVLGCKPWNRRLFDEHLTTLSGRWYFVGSPEELSLKRVKQLSPRYFFLALVLEGPRRTCGSFRVCVFPHDRCSVRPRWRPTTEPHRPGAPRNASNRASHEPRIRRRSGVSERGALAGRRRGGNLFAGRTFVGRDDSTYHPAGTNAQATTRQASGL